MSDFNGNGFIARLENRDKQKDGALADHLAGAVLTG